MKTINFYLIALILLSSCVKEKVHYKDDEELPTVYAEAKILKDVSYGSDVKHVMDIYLPANRSTATTKVFVLIHGGAWTGGDKAEMNYIIGVLQTDFPDYAIFNINYRLFNIIGFKNKFPSQENDVNAAVNFILNNRTAYGISDKWVLSGVSAGAHLSLLQSYKHTDKIKPQAVVSYAGPTDLNDLASNPGPDTGIMMIYFNSLVNGTQIQSSPITHVNASTIPTLIFHGGRDGTVPIRQAQLLDTKLSSFKVIHQFVEYPNSGHVFSDGVMLETLDIVKPFLQANVK